MLTDGGETSSGGVLGGDGEVNGDARGRLGGRQGFERLGYLIDSVGADLESEKKASRKDVELVLP